MWHARRLDFYPLPVHEGAPEPAVRAILDELFLAALSRHPSAAEGARLLPLFELPGDPATVRREAAEDALWTLLNSREFLSNR